MRRFAALAGLILALMPLLGCGYFRSGTWVEDPENFARAWGYAKPDAVHMLHSWYWRSAHFTREESYFFQFQWNEELFRRFVAANRMQPQEPLPRGPGSEPEYLLCEAGLVCSTAP